MRTLEKPNFYEVVIERTNVLRKMDIDVAGKFFSKHSKEAKKLDLSDVYDRNTIEVTLHKVRSACIDLSNKEREFSIKWLKERGFEPLTEDCLF